MNHQQQVLSSRASANGFVHRRVDRDNSGRFESKVHVPKASSGICNNRGLTNAMKVVHSSPSRDKLVYAMAHCIGQHVEVHVKNGSVIFGIFHAANVDKDFGIVIKKAHTIKDGSGGGHSPVTDLVLKPQTMIIPARELVQLIVKDIALTTDGLPSCQAQEKRKDLLIDSAISLSRHSEERELERWAPDADDSECIELENIYDRKWSRSWDQFEINKALFGVKSTYNEEIYTTKLVRGPHTRELEEQATRIAREIEGEQTDDLHLAEERNKIVDDDLDHDEELKYSAVCRNWDDNKLNKKEKLSKSTNNIWSSLGSHSGAAFSEVLDKKGDFNIVDDRSSIIVGTGSHSTQLPSNGLPSKSLNTTFGDIQMSDGKLIKDNGEEICTWDTHKEESCVEQGKPSVPEGNKYLDGSSSEATVVGKVSSVTEPGNLRPRSSTSIAEPLGATTVSGAISLSPSSSVGSLTSEKSTLNPNAKEFRLNPNAKSFTPTASIRPNAPGPDGSYYYPGLPHVSGLPMGMAVGPSFGGHQPLIYNPHAPPQMQSPQGYMQPGGPIFGQQMIVGQSRPVYYMQQQYTPEIQYRGRSF